jgi:hypothetical protein
VDPDTKTRYQGSDAKAVAKSRLDHHAKGFVSVSRRSEVEKKAFSKAFPTAEAAEIVGTGPYEEFWRMRLWVVRGKETPSTFFLLVHEYLDSSGLDPEVEAVLQSLSEPKQKK